MFGNIPSHLTLFVSGPVEISSPTYDDLDIAICTPKSVYPTFVSDALNKKTCETGKKWADTNRRYDPQSKTSIQIPYTIENIKNDPIDNIIITSIEHRTNGGRAYKVIINNKYYVDLREDILLDVILNEGIDIGGKLKGQYIWAKVKSAMKLIRVNSDLYEELLKLTDIDLQGKIKKLEVGRIYKTKRDSCVFLGEFNTTTVNDIGSNYKNTITKKGFVFYDVYEFNNFKIEPTQYWRYKFVKTHNMKIDTGINCVFPDNWLENLKATEYFKILRDISTFQYKATIKSFDLLNLQTEHEKFKEILLKIKEHQK